MPTAPAIQFSFAHCFAATEPLENAKRQLVRLLLPLQLTSGEFVARAQSWDGTSITMLSILGPSFEAFVIATRAQYTDQVGTLLEGNDGIFETIARTTSVVALLELHFRSCQDIWLSLSSKAKQYLRLKRSSADVFWMEGFVTKELARATFHIGSAVSPATTATSDDVRIPLPTVRDDTAQTALQQSSEAASTICAEPEYPFGTDDVQSTTTSSSQKIPSSMPLGSEAPGGSSSGHEDLIWLTVAERMARGGGGVDIREEVEVPDDIF